ncbi:MAG: methyltransferase domain-containing protein, partial [Candidatus Nitrotoga sp.]
MAGLADHYSVNDIETQILAALRAAGLDPEQRLSPVELGALDHFHTGGFRASLVLKDLAQIRAEDRVLDIGAGLAGPARMLAASPGCQVDCIDLSPDYYVAALLLNRLTGLGEQVAIHVGSALEIPFADNLFDVVWMQNVGMNIPDKPKLYQEINRILKPGGRFAFQEMVAGETPVKYFPLPWATDATDHFLISQSEMHTVLTRSGFSALYFEDVSETPLPSPQNETAEVAAQAPLSLSAY